MFDDKTRAALAGEPRRLRRRVRRPRRRRSTRRSARSGRCCATSSPVLRNLSRPETRTSSASSRRSATPPRCRARRRGAGVSCSCNLDTHVGARCATVARPFIQDSITEGKPALDAGDPRASRASARSCATPRACSASCARASRALRTRRAGPRRRARDRHRGAAAHAAAQPAPGVAAARAADVLRGPAVPRGIDGSTDVVSTLNPTLHYLAPAQTPCNYMTLWFRNVSSLLSEGDATAPGSGSSSSPRRRAPTTRAARPPRPANGPTVDNHLHTNPYPNTASPGQPQGVRGRQRAATPRGQDRDRQRRRARSGRRPRGRRP